jgi:glycosyltransferase involved in cell wall biosynthesis
MPHLGGGGAEQVMALLARGLPAEKYEIHFGLVTQADQGGAALPPWVTIHALGARRVRAGALPLVQLAWHLRPRIILSGAAETNFLALLLRPFLPFETRVLVRQNGTVSATLASGLVPWYTRQLYRLLYRQADRVICQSRAMADDLMHETGIGRERLAVLPNPIDVEAIHAAMQSPYAWSGSGPHLLAVGRLARVKGFDLLLEALAIVRRQFPGADLLIAGAGGEETALRQQCHSLGLDAVVHFAGHVDCPYAYFPGATVFVLSSRYEGMPNALLEAAAAGLPIVATPASGGIVDLLGGRPGTWLAPEVSSGTLAATLLSALKAIRPAEHFRHSFFPSTSDWACRAEHLLDGSQFRQ